MQRKPTRSARPLLWLLPASAVAAVAMLALAGPAAAHRDHGEDNGKHHHGKHHGKKHHKRFHQLQGSQGEAAGTIASFDAATGRLTIALTGGDSVSGLVTEDTWIDDGSCDHHGWSGEDDRGRRTLHGWDDDDWGDDDGRGSTDDLVPGATVDEAILLVKDGKAVFFKIELARSDGAPTAS